MFMRQSRQLNIFTSAALLFVIVLLVAACGGNAAPTPTTAPADEFVPNSGVTMTPAPAAANLTDFTASDPALVGKTGRPQMVMFYASWCEDCHQMRPTVFAAQDEFKDFVDFLYIDIDAQNTEAVRKQLNGTEARPTIVFLDPEGQEVGRLVGIQPKDVFQKMLDQILTVG